METHTVAQQSARSSALLFAGNITATGLLTISSILIARLLGPVGYGEYTLVLQIPNLFVVFVGFGVNIALTRYSAFLLSRGELERARRITTSAVTFLLIAGALLTVACLMSATILSSFLISRPGLAGIVAWASAFILGQTALQAGTAALIGWDRPGRAGAVTIVQAALKLILSVGLLVAGFGLFGAIAGHVVMALAAGVVSLVFVYRLGMSRVGGLSSMWRDTSELLRFSIPVYIGNSIAGIASLYIFFTLANVAPNSTVGYFQAAYNFTMAISLPASSIASALLPAFSTISEGTRDALKYSVKYVGYILAPVPFFLIVTARPVFQIFYSPVYSAGIPYLQLLAAAFVPVVLGTTVLPTFVTGLGRTRTLLILSVISAAPIFVLGPIFSYALRLGVPGLVACIGFSHLALAIAGWVSAKSLGHQLDLRSAGLILLSASAAAAAGWIPSLLALPSLEVLVLQFVVFAAVYATLVPMVRALELSDIETLTVLGGELGWFGVPLRAVLKYQKRVLTLL